MQFVFGEEFLIVCRRTTAGSHVDHIQTAGSSVQPHRPQDTHKFRGGMEVDSRKTGDGELWKNVQLLIILVIIFRQLILQYGLFIHTFLPWMLKQFIDLQVFEENKVKKNSVLIFCNPDNPSMTFVILFLLY